MDREIKRTTKEEQILEMVQRGRTISEIAAELRMSRQSVRAVVDNWVRVYSDRAADGANELIMTSLMRLDYIYQQLLPYALPRVDDVSGLMLPPDSKLVLAVKQIVAEQREWVKLHTELARRSPQDEMITLEPTLSTNDYLFASALGAEEDGDDDKPLA